MNAFLSMLAFGSASCAFKQPRNPSFPVTREEARSALKEMVKTRKALERPVVVLAGYLDPGLGSRWIAWQFKRLTGDRRVLDVSFLFCSTFDQCRTRLIEQVDKAFPNEDPTWTTEVDVIALSMGGLVARYAAALPGPSHSIKRRLNISRLFTIGCPHRGARMASLPCFLTLHTDMRAGSRFLDRLNDAYRERNYELYAYVRLNDRIVGSENAAPPGENPLWVSTPPLQPAHIGAVLDARIIADIARRLRGEMPYSTASPAPIPEDDPSTGRQESEWL